jgi:hypothetical protein
MGAQLFHVGGRTDRETHTQTLRQTDMTKLVAAFGNFANAPEEKKGT